MAVCLDYQSVYCSRASVRASVRLKCFAAIVVLAALVTRVWIKIESTDVGYQLAKERQKTVLLDMDRRELELQLSVLLRPDSLARSAEKRLGLASLRPGQIVRVN